MAQAANSTNLVHRTALLLRWVQLVLAGGTAVSGEHGFEFVGPVGVFLLAQVVWAVALTVLLLRRGPEPMSHPALWAVDGVVCLGPMVMTATAPAGALVVTANGFPLLVGAFGGIA